MALCISTCSLLLHSMQVVQRLQMSRVSAALGFEQNKKHPVNLTALHQKDFLNHILDS